MAMFRNISFVPSPADGSGSKQKLPFTNYLFSFLMEFYLSANTYGRCTTPKESFAFFYFVKGRGRGKEMFCLIWKFDITQYLVQAFVCVV